MTYTQIRTEVPLDSKVFEIRSVLNHQAVLVGQMQGTYEAVARRDISECFLGVYGLEVIHDVCESEGAIDSLHC